MTRPLCGEVSEAKSDLEEAISQGGTDDETITTYAVTTTLRPSNRDKGNEWWRYIPLKLVYICAMADPQSIAN